MMTPIKMTIPQTISQKSGAERFLKMERTLSLLFDVRFAKVNDALDDDKHDEGDAL